MKKTLIAVALFCWCAISGAAHRLDEYLQATILSIKPQAVQGTIRLVPGVAVASGVIAAVDTNQDGVITPEEGRRYAEKVLADLRLREDDRALQLHLMTATFPGIEQMKAGSGEAELSFKADLPVTRGRHKLTFENHHLQNISVYLVNSLVPQDKNLHIEAQSRNQNQSFYQVAFAETDESGRTVKGLNWSGFEGAFKLGIRHIAEGTDHLLFLLTLLLPAPLLAFAGRWRERATIRLSLGQILRIVTAFTLGHSLTLALAGFGLVRVPSRPVEVLIAVSILVSAIHAIRPMFPGHEASLAASFGLIHGLAFAAALNGVGIDGWYRLVSLLGFNLGIEVVQVAVVAVTLPALVLLSRTQFYSVFRYCGAAFAIIASLAWIVERILQTPNAIGEGIERSAHHSVLLTLGLWTCSASAWIRKMQSVRNGRLWTSDANRGTGTT